MKNCAIIVNGFYTNTAIEHQVSSIKAEMENRGVACSVIKGDTIFCHVQGGGCVCEIDNIDFAVYLDKDIHAARMLEKCGIRLFNSATAVELCDDKMLTYIALCDSGVRMPYTISSPVMYYLAEDGEFVDRVESRIDYPIVVKQSYGSMGMGVHLASNRAELLSLRERLRLQPHLYQQMIGKGGVDKRVILVGGEILACMQRENVSDFRSNIEHGGIGKVTSLTDEEKYMAEVAAKTLGLDYCGVDILTDADGRAYICEVNSNAFFRGIQGVTGVNIAAAYVDHILKKVY